MQELYDWIKYVDEWMLPWNTIGWVCIIVFSMAVIALSIGVNYDKSNSSFVC